MIVNKMIANKIYKHVLDYNYSLNKAKNNNIKLHYTSYLKHSTKLNNKRLAKSIVFFNAEEFDDFVSKTELTYSNMSALSENLSLKIEYIIKHYTLSWDWWCLSKNPSITTIENIKKYPDFKWIKEVFSANHALPIDFILSQSSVNLVGLSSHPELTMDIIISEMDKHSTRWNWVLLSNNKAISIKTMHNNPIYPWSNMTALVNKPLRFVDALTMVEYSNSIKIISQYCIITMDEIHKFKDIIDWESLTLNNSVSYEDIVLNPDLPWVYSVVKYKKNLNLYNYRECSNSLVYKQSSELLTDACIEIIADYYNGNTQLCSELSQFSMSTINKIIHPFLDEMKKRVYFLWHRMLSEPINFENTTNKISKQLVDKGKYTSIDDVCMFDIYDEVVEDIEKQIYEETNGISRP